MSKAASVGAFESTRNVVPVATTSREHENSGQVQGDRNATETSITRFVRDPERLRAKQDQIVAATRRQSAAAELEKLFAQDLLALVGPEMRRMGLDDQDVADMTAVYWIAAWEASQGIVGRKTDPRVAKGARDQLARTFTNNPAIQRMSDAAKQEIADTMLLQAFLVEARMSAAAKAGSAAQKRMSDTIYAEANRLLKTDLRKVTLTAAGFAPAARASAGASGSSGTAPQASDANASAAAASPAPHSGNWAQVEGVYFRSYAGFGVGGMVISDFEPLVLLRDGTYYEIEDKALEDVDLAASRRARPQKWGRWTRSGESFTLTSAKGRPSQYKLQDGAFFQAFPAEAGGNRLAAKYKRVSGGGNSAMGGEMTIAAQTNMSFAPDGRYTRASSAGSIGSGDSTGVATSAYSRNRTGVGRYRIERYTITLTEPDGRTRRQFFAFASRKTPPQPTTNMIFLGDRVYIKDD